VIRNREGRGGRHSIIRNWDFALEQGEKCGSREKYQIEPAMMFLTLPKKLLAG